jgi:hypothetical protein
LGITQPWQFFWVTGILSSFLDNAPTYLTFTSLAQSVTQSLPVTGIATAYMDSIPILVLTGQIPTLLIGNDAFQEADIIGITRPCTKHNYLVKDIKDLGPP